MKKTLMALAVFGTVAGAVQAQSAVIIYGVVDVKLTHEDNGSTSITSLNKLDHSGNLNGSRLGFKGSEDLGGGLAAIFLIESGFNADDGTQADPARLFNRQSFVGLTGGFGTVKLGRQQNPVYANVQTFDPFSNSRAGDSQRLFGYNGSRTDNLITYGYTANGFRGELQYGLGEVAGNASANRTLAGLAGYKKGPVDVVLTHQNIRNLADTGSTRVTLLGGNYDFGVVKAFATYAVEKGVVSGAAATAPSTPLDQRDALVGLTAPVGAAGTFLISYIRKTDKAVTNADARQVAIGYTYDLSKRTALYTSYGELHNDSKATYAKVIAGKTDKLFDVGIRHFF